MEKVKRGVARYVDDELVGKMSGWQRWVIGAGFAMYLENFSSNMQKLKEHPVVKSLGLMDDNGNIAVERMYQHIKMQAQKGPVTLEIPAVGSVTLHDSDVDKLYTLIMQA
jgi:hypothetical protein